MRERSTFPGCLDPDWDPLVATVTAYHEAGHAVVRWRLDQRIKEIWIRPEGGMTLGNPILGPFDPEMMSPGEWNRAEIKLMVLLAGECAEKVYHDIAQDGIFDYISGGDRSEIEELLGKIGEHIAAPVSLDLQRLETETQSMVEESWDVICAVADALLHRRRLSGDEVTTLIATVAQEFGLQPKKRPG